MSNLDEARAASGNFAAAEPAHLVHRAAELWDDYLGDRLSGLYLIGSLAHGGYSARYSDIDVALVTNALLTTEELEAVLKVAEVVGESFAEKLSLFWTDDTFASGRFPILDRIDYLDHRVPVWERRQALPARPTLREVRHYLAGAALRDWSRHVERFIALQELPLVDSKRYLRALLYPARYAFSWQTGAVCSNDDAVAFSLTNGLFGAGTRLIEQALLCRRTGRDPAHLWPERKVLLELRQACEALAGS
jgi:predicted nucleotidyltransferase